MIARVILFEQARNVPSSALRVMYRSRVGSRTSPLRDEGLVEKKPPGGLVGVRLLLVVASSAGEGPGQRGLPSKLARSKLP